MFLEYRLTDLAADHLQLLTIFIENIQPYVSPSEENPAVNYCQEILPVLSRIAENFTSFTPILERVCRCWRYMVLSYRTAILPLLPSLAQQLASGFENSRQGCFLWATDSVLREFALGAEFVDAATSQAIYNFFEQQAVAFLRIMNDLPPKDLPDGLCSSALPCVPILLTTECSHRRLLPPPDRRSYILPPATDSSSSLRPHPLRLSRRFSPGTG